MPAMFDEAYESLNRAQECLDAARAEHDPMSQSTQLKVCLHAVNQAALIAHRTYEIRNPLVGSDGGGTRTWAKNELEAFSGIAFRAFASRQALVFDEMERDCELWLGRAKFFVDRLAAETPLVAQRVNETLLEWDLKHTGKVVRWEEKDGELIDRTE